MTPDVGSDSSAEWWVEPSYVPFSILFLSFFDICFPGSYCLVEFKGVPVTAVGQGFLIGLFLFVESLFVAGDAVQSVVDVSVSEQQAGGWSAYVRTVVHR